MKLKHKNGGDGGNSINGGDSIEKRSVGSEQVKDEAEFDK